MSDIWSDYYGEDKVKCPCCDDDDVRSHDGYPGSWEEPPEPASACCQVCGFEWNPDWPPTDEEVSEARLETIHRLLKRRAK